MNAIEWDESYSVGVEELDEQHKQLFRMINTLFEVPNVAVESQTISDLLTDVKEYTSYHFETEERYMSECGYPDIAAHMRAHEQFRKKVDDLWSARMAHRKGVPADILQFLYEWLSAHVLSCDKKYAALVSSHRG